ncbi:hypothetical protein D3C73_1581420 [compost metagenome]
MTIYLSRLTKGQPLAFTQPEGRRIYLFVLEGALLLNDGEKLARRDEARVTETTELALEAAEDSLFMLIDLP